MALNLIQDTELLLRAVHPRLRRFGLHLYLIWLVAAFGLTVYAAISYWPFLRTSGHMFKLIWIAFVVVAMLILFPTMLVERFKLRDEEDVQEKPDVFVFDSQEEYDRVTAPIDFITGARNPNSRRQKALAKTDAAVGKLAKPLAPLGWLLKAIDSVLSPKSWKMAAFLVSVLVVIMVFEAVRH